ncbi:transglycosylase SLT domain-containing protein [Amphibiibacter pelophylacis]|uniref:Transglycosylase SLT domain-containing protein n=1 Tax=Amphibiibacter pelophylacis TaxID=1799477 RepID=A0ACC6P3R0_9BURK
MRRAAWILALATSANPLAALAQNALDESPDDSGITVIIGDRPAQTLRSTSVPGVMPTGDDLILQARDAFRRKDSLALASLADAAQAARHPLAGWVAYWALNSRLDSATPDEVNAFFRTWANTYVEDRLRNDWLLELGKRRDWAQIRANAPLFRMNDDNAVSCYALLADDMQGQPVDRERARSAWLRQTRSDDGCTLMSTTFMNRILTPQDAWQRAMADLADGRTALAQRAIDLADPQGQGLVPGTTSGMVLSAPERFLDTTGGVLSAPSVPLQGWRVAMALMQLGNTDAYAAAQRLQTTWQAVLPPLLVHCVWAHLARRAGFAQAFEATQYAEQAWTSPGVPAQSLLDPFVLEWNVRALLRVPRPNWALVQRVIDAMPEATRQQSRWRYWKARALIARGGALAAQGQALMQGVAAPLDFYGQLATQDLGQPLQAPPQAQASAQAVGRVAAHPGLQRALQLMGLELRSEGVREWNYSLRGLGDDDLLAAAQLACSREIWDRCIFTSDRTAQRINLAQRYPTPFQPQVMGTAAGVGIDPSWVYGLVRQESRFQTAARSGVGATGLMQVIPSTAKLVARRIGVSIPANGVVRDLDTNLLLGMSYLFQIGAEFGEQQALTTAAYNAGPGRPRRWRQGPTLESAAWVETIPFAETRDYVQKVLGNAVAYDLVLGRRASLKARLGTTIGPDDGGGIVQQIVPQN